MHKLLTFAALAISLSPASLRAQTAPNTLLIVADDVGVDAVGCYGIGSSPPPTPNIDALAAGGVRFTSAYACPTCSPTRASLLTGRHGFRTGVGVAIGGGLEPGLDASEVLLPELLGPRGVTTAMMGKWHLGNDAGAATPTAEGFDLFAGTLVGALPDYYAWNKIENGQFSPCSVYATTETVDDAIAFVNRTQGPWFLEVCLHAAHSPYHEPPSHLHTQDLAGLDPQVDRIPFYHAMVEAMDTEIGRLLASLPAGTPANTNVVFVGDNGTAPGSAEPPIDSNRCKGTVYQGGVRVPLIVRGPAVGGAPRVEPALAHVVDLFVTLAAWQGADAAAAVPVLDGVDLTPVLQSAGHGQVRDFVYTQQFVGDEPMAAPGDQEMIRDARFTLLRFVQSDGSVRSELYDLVTDEWQNDDLLSAPLDPLAAASHRELERRLALLRGYAWSGAFGAGCSGAGVHPTLSVEDQPTLGETFSLRVQGLTPGVLATIGALGFDGDDWLGVALPVDLTPAGLAGCLLWVDPVTTTVLPQLPLQALWPIALPGDPALTGAALFLQAFALVPNANPAGIVASGAVEAIVGA